MPNEKVDDDRLMTRRQLLEMVPLSYSSVWDLMRQGEFPLTTR